jgi:rhodanese-related sulfurtransferase
MSQEEYHLPEISALELAEWLKGKPDLVLLDVREEYEVAQEPLQDRRVVVAPLSRLARLQADGLPEQVRPAAEIVVFCHLGERSAQVTYWLSQYLGFPHVFNLYGGIVAYHSQVRR